MQHILLPSAEMAILKDIKILKEILIEIALVSNFMFVYVLINLLLSEGYLHK
jgi:hypothetical protein